MLSSNFTNESPADDGFELLQNGYPTVLGFARLCGYAIARSNTGPIDLTACSPEARAIACAARSSGMIELRGNKNAFEPTDRLIAVCVVDADRRLVFKRKSDPRRTVAFLDGFRQLCANGLVMHHLLFDFSLTHSGFAWADSLDVEELKPLIEFGIVESS